MTINRQFNFINKILVFFFFNIGKCSRGDILVFLFLLFAEPLSTVEKEYTRESSYENILKGK
jgi:hypothetical protein